MMPTGAGRRDESSGKLAVLSSTPGNSEALYESS